VSNGVRIMSHSPGINATRARLHFKAERLFGFIEQFQRSAFSPRIALARNANKWRHPSIPEGKIKTVNLPDGVCHGFVLIVPIELFESLLH
jgi:hypothetical protein